MPLGVLYYFVQVASLLADNKTDCLVVFVHVALLYPDVAPAYLLVLFVAFPNVYPAVAPTDCVVVFVAILHPDVASAEAHRVDHALAHLRALQRDCDGSEHDPRVRRAEPLPRPVRASR